MLSEDRRREIATFLRNRRSRRQPEDVGLPRTGRRRTPGLRRGEVALLAGVSTEWYTWLEQARDVQPSAETLRRISTALRLEPGEQQHLLTLSGYAMDGNTNGRSRMISISTRLQHLLDQLMPCPAWVFGDRWDVLAWNGAATIVLGDLDTQDEFERNLLYQMFLHPRMRRMLLDWDAHAGDCVAKLRLMHARNVDDPWYNDLIQRLRKGSAEFAALWNEHNVQLPRGGVKRYDHPDVGLLTFEYTVLGVTGEQMESLQLITYVPAGGTDTRAKLEALLRGEQRTVRRPARVRQTV